VVSIYKCPKIFGEKKTKFWTTFSATSALDTVYLRNETLHLQTKIILSISDVSPKSRPTFRDFDPETAEIRLLMTVWPTLRRHV